MTQIIANLTPSKVLGKVANWYRVMEEAGLTYDDLQRAIDDPAFRHYLIDAWHRHLETLKFPEIVIQSPSQRRAAVIMGTNFLGLGAVEKHFGVEYTPRLLQFLAEIPWSDDVLQECKDTHILFPGYPLAGSEIWEWRKNPHHKAWYFFQNFFWKTKVQLRWYLFRKDVTPGSCLKNYGQQLKGLAVQDEVPRFCEVLFGITLLLAERGEKLFETHFVRCSDSTANADRPCVGNYGQLGWKIESQGIYSNHPYLGLASARKLPNTM